jgi:MFS family permease
MSDQKEKHSLHLVPECNDAMRTSDEPATSSYLAGWKLHGVTFFIFVSLFVAQMDTSVTSTAILNITDELGSYEKNSWVFTAYLLTYCGMSASHLTQRSQLMRSIGFQLIWAKLSDIISRKFTIMTSLLIFTAFSGACGASRTTTQLIMFRWVQGIGGCGVFALAQLVFFELVPPSKWPLYVSLFSVVVAFSLVIGPLIGGAIAEQSRVDGDGYFCLSMSGLGASGSANRRHFCSVPVCCSAFIGLFVMFPAKLPNEPANAQGVGAWKPSAKRLDVVGFMLLLGACILLSTSLQQAGQGYAWTSSYVLPMLITAPIFIVAFLAWEWRVTKRPSPEPVFPWRFCESRVRVGMILNSFLSGGTMMICLVQIPQRFMAVNGLSSSEAAVRLLAFGAFIPAGSILATVLMNKPRIPAAVIVLAGACLQIIGAILLWRIPTSTQIYRPQYAYQVLLGTGVGFLAAALLLLVPFIMDKQDLG